MIDWLLDIGNKYLNKERVSFVCRAMLCLVAIPVLLIVFLILYQTKDLKDIANIIVEICQLLYDFGLAFLCLALMRLLYRDNYNMPTIGYYVVVLVIKGVYQFFITSTGSKGELTVLIVALVLILHIVVGLQLLKTRYAIFGKAFLYYLGGILLSAIFSASHVNLLPTISTFFACGILVYIFYKYLPTYYE